MPRIVSIVIVLALAHIATAANLIQSDQWQAKQRWMRSGSHYEQMTEGDRTFIRLKKSPVLLQQTITVQPTMAAVKLAAVVRAQDLKKDGRWGGGAMRLRFLDAAGKPLKGDGAAKFFLRDQDWEAVEREAEVPDGAKQIEVWLEYRAQAGTVDFAEVTLQTTETQAAPQAASAQATSAAREADAKAATPVKASDRQNLLESTKWATNQPWQSQGEYWDKVKDGDASFIRLMKKPVLLQQKVNTAGSLAKVELAADVRISDLQTDGRWGVVTIALKCLDANGQVIKGAGGATRFRGDQDWKHEQVQAEVPTEARAIEIWLDYRAAKGHADFANLSLTATERREASGQTGAQAATTAGKQSTQAPAPVKASKQRNLLESDAWATRQPWQSQGEFWDKVEEGDASFIRLMKKPAVVQQTIQTDGSFAKVKLSADVRISDLQTDGRWGVVTMALKFLDADDEVIKGSGGATRFRNDQDWKHEEFEVAVPTDVYGIEVWLDYRAAKGHADFANLSLTATELREAPARASRAAAGSGPSTLEYDENATWYKDPVQRPVTEWKASVDVNAVRQTIHVAPDGNGDGSAANPFGSIRAALMRASELVRDGVPTKLYLADGIYRQSWFELRAAKVGGKAAETLLVVEGQSTDGVRIRGSEMAGFQPDNWALVDKARNIYRLDWTKSELAPVPENAWSPAIQAISRHRVMVFVNGAWLKPVQLEQYTHEKTREEKYEREHGGISTRRTIVDTYTGFTGLDAMPVGSVAVNTLGPGENAFDKHPHAYPNSLLIRLPKDVDFAKAQVEVAYGASSAFRFIGKNNIAVRNLTIEHMGIAGLFIKNSDNVLVEGVDVINNDGGGGSCGLRIMKCRYVTLRDSRVNHNGPFGLHLACKFATVEHVQVNGNNWRGGLSGHVMHAGGGCSGKFSHIQFLDSQFNDNYGFGLRQDGMGEHAVIERCQFNGNRINGGMMWEITYGPINVRDSQIIANRGVGIHLTSVHGFTLERSTVVNNAEGQIELHPMLNRGKIIAKGVPRFSGPTRWPLNAEEDKGFWIEGIVATTVSESTIAVTDPSVTDVALYHGKYWPNNIHYYEDWLANQLQANRNVYWHAAGEHAFDAGKAQGERTNYSTLTEWRQMTGEDGTSVWRQPDSVYPLPPKAEVGSEDIPVHRQ